MPAHVTHDHGNQPPASLVTAFVLLIGLFVWVLRFEWIYSEDYRYGWIVPPFVLLLLYFRWSGRPTETAPPVRAANISRLLLFIGVGGSLPFFFFQAAGPDYLPLLWVFGFWTIALGLLVLYNRGGVRWVAHFGVPWAMLLLAIPWPAWLHQPVVNGMMGVVAFVVGQGLSFAGIFAESSGNLIVLANGSVGVDEACSGIRSFQLAVTLGFFIGEALRFSTLGRFAILLFGMATAVALNVARSLSLSLLYHNGAQPLMDEWHDFVGMTAMIVLVAAILGTAVLFDGLGTAPGSRDHKAKGSGNPIQPLPWRTVGISLLITVIGFGLTQAWYGIRSPLATHQLAIREDALPKTWKSVTLPESVRNILRYSEAFCGQFNAATDASEPISLYLFSWRPGRVSSKVAGHRPDVCLPSAGWRYAGAEPARTFPIPQTGLQVTITPHRFVAPDGTILHSFWGAWDRLGAEGAIERGVGNGTLVVRNALAGKRIAGRQTLNIIWTGSEPLETKWSRIDQVLSQITTIEEI